LKKQNLNPQTNELCKFGTLKPLHLGEHVEHEDQYMLRLSMKTTHLKSKERNSKQKGKKRLRIWDTFYFSNP